MSRTSIMACLVVLAASGAMAQTNAGKAGAVNLDPGSSGGTAGLISGGGTVSSNLDARDNRPNPDARVTDRRKQAKADSDAKEERMSKARIKAARARAEADEEEKSNRTRKAKKPQQQRLFGYPYVYPNGFAMFGSRGFARSRD